LGKINEFSSIRKDVGGSERAGYVVIAKHVYLIDVLNGHMF
jgi:hypothetical protein